MVNSDFVTDAELLRYINESISELYDMLITAKGQEWYIQTYDITTAVGVSDYEVPEAENFYLLLGVDINANTGSAVPLRPYMLDERHDPTNSLRFAYAGGAPNMRYRLSGVVQADGNYKHRISFIPAPGSALTVKLLYIPHAPEFAIANIATDKWDGFNGWEEYVVVDSAIKCLEKEESSTVALERRKERLMGRIEGLASAHDDGFPERVADITGRLRYRYDV
jgi:hypothetical protein